MRKIAAFALALACIAATCVQTSDWSAVDLHPLRDATEMSLEITRADGTRVVAHIGHLVRPEGESAVQGTVRTGLHCLSIFAAGVGGVAGNPLLLSAGLAAAELTR